MSGAIRSAQLADVPRMIDLSERKRVAYERYHPTFHRKAADSRERQTPFFERLIGGERTIALVHEEGQAIDGFIIGTLVEAPPVYDPGGLTCIVDDFVVAQPEDWATVGAALLGEVSSWAKAQGAVQTVVVCGHQDEPKRAMLAALGYAIASEWYVANIGEVWRKDATLGRMRGPDPGSLPGTARSMEARPSPSSRCDLRAATAGFMGIGA